MNILKKTQKKRHTNNWLKKISPKISRKIKKEENLQWFQSKIYEIFSNNISLRYSSHLVNSNKKKIERLLSLNEKNKIIEILNSSIEAMFDKYINNEKIEGFKTLEDDINELRTQMKKSSQSNIEEYLIKYEEVAKNMKQIFILKNSRNTFTEDISIINRNIDPKHDIYEKENFLEKNFGNSLIDFSFCGYMFS